MARVTFSSVPAGHDCGYDWRSPLGAGGVALAAVTVMSFAAGVSFPQGIKCSKQLEYHVTIQPVAKRGDASLTPPSLGLAAVIPGAELLPESQIATYLGP
jgi:hypothetical protein